jgi:hypothetical protein
MLFSKEEFPTADLVLATSNNVSLYVHRTILTIASPFFKGSFFS